MKGKGDSMPFLAKTDDTETLFDTVNATIDYAVAYLKQLNNQSVLVYSVHSRTKICEVQRITLEIDLNIGSAVYISDKTSGTTVTLSRVRL